LQRLSAPATVLKNQAGTEIFLINAIVWDGRDLPLVGYQATR
jgi:hypothetical protein